jgi:hypothetical protein
MRLGHDLSNLDLKFSELAVTLLAASLGGHGRDSSEFIGRNLEDLTGAAMGTHSAVAWHSFQLGQQSMEDWNLNMAQEAFQRAPELDPGYALASHLSAGLKAESGPHPHCRWTVSTSMRDLSLVDRE